MWAKCCANPLQYCYEQFTLSKFGELKIKARALQRMDEVLFVSGKSTNLCQATVGMPLLRVIFGPLLCS